MREDAGTRTVREAFDELQVDAEWASWSDRGFTWWPHRFAQQVWAEMPREDDGITVIRVNAETDLYSLNEQDWRGMAPVFASASAFSTSSGFVWRDQVVRLHSSMWVHDEIQPWVSKVFRLACLFQAVGAEAAIAQKSGLPPHVTGNRREPDEMLAAIDELPGKDEPSLWAGDEMTKVVDLLEANGLVANGSHQGITTEFPYGTSGGPAIAGGTSNLLTVTTEEPHPSFGSGLLMRLMLREEPTGPAGSLGAMELNELEIQTGCNAHFIGSWCSNPSGGPPVFVSFLPSILSAPNLLFNLVISMRVRSRWVETLFS